MLAADDAALRPLLDELKARQIAFFQARLVSSEAEHEWRSNLIAAYRALLARPLGELVDADSLAQALDDALSPRAAHDAAGPVMRRFVPAATAGLRANERPLGDYVPQQAREVIDALLMGGELIPPRLVRELLEDEAIEDVMRDVLYDVLTEFSDKVNPFFAEWGLPALLKRVMPIGFGALSKTLEAVRSEFNARLEPEIRRFLRGVTRGSLRKAADVMAAASGDRKFIALRQRVAHWLYAQPVGELVAGVTDEHARQTQVIGELVSAHWVGRDDVRKHRRAALTAFVAAHATTPLGELLSRYEITYEPDFNALARATWPMLAATLQSEPVKAWVAKLINSFYESLDQGGSAGG